MISTMSPSLHFGMRHLGLAAACSSWPAYVDGIGNVKIALSVRPYYCCIHMQTFRTVGWLFNLRLNGKLYEDKMLRLYTFTIFCGINIPRISLNMPPIGLIHTLWGRCRPSVKWII